MVKVSGGTSDFADTKARGSHLFSFQSIYKQFYWNLVELKLTSFMRVILKMFIISLLVFSCQKENQNKNKFKFEYLDDSNIIISDSIRIKFNLYFNNISIRNANKSLANINKHSEEKGTLKAFLLKNDNHNPYTPQRLKRIKTTNDYGLDNHVLDSLFYESFDLDQLTFLADEYYQEIENLRLTRLKYDDQIYNIIRCIYDFKRPITFYDNSIGFNLEFKNVSSKNIKYFEGILYVNNKNMDNVLSTDINSSVLNQNIVPNPLKASSLDNWNIRAINTYSSNPHDLRLNVSSSIESTLKNNYSDLIILFVPSKIVFEDGTILKN
ncbi:hypothetical protein [Kordia sp.]|uniref:hypothetical protein n=1 Tax=Kordia sp. TaxID=1965332 RepID=UPI003D6BF7E8